MVKLVKSQVKCYKKKTKKNVGGQKKTYEYNQYLVPLKRSDNLDCSMEVFVIPKSDLGNIIDEEGKLRDISVQEDEYKRHLAEYETELADLEWKHSQLSKSYKELFKKQNKTRKKNQELEKIVEALKSDREKLIAALQKVKDARMNENKDIPKTVSKAGSKETIKDSSLVEKVEMIEGSKVDKIDENKESKEIKDSKEDKDLWTVLRSRLIKKEEDEK
ncbi:MAG: hypothetical protein HVN35_02970 [Methanobacteriaceae archaeon]|nr:hypothetical protein [Methanobacteriaceae archaeon]